MLSTWLLLGLLILTETSSFAFENCLAHSGERSFRIAESVQRNLRPTHEPRWRCDVRIQPRPAVAKDREREVENTRRKIRTTPQLSMASTSSSTTATSIHYLLDSQAESLLDDAGWEETEGSEHGCPCIINLATVDDPYIHSMVFYQELDVFGAVPVRKKMKLLTMGGIHCISSTTMRAQRERICVLGGGFGGLYTALRLDKMPWRGQKPSVVLVDKRDKFTFLPLLYEFAVGSAELDEVAPTFRELLTGSDVSFVQACVSGVDLQAKKVSVVGAVSDDLDGFVISDNQEEPRTLEFDKLVLAVGAEPASGMEKVPGALESAIPFYSIEDSYRVKQAIRELKARLKKSQSARVVVVGGSYAGVEISSNLATELGRGASEGLKVTLVTNSEILANATPSNREAGVRRLRQSGVRVVEGVRVKSVKEGGAVIVGGTEDDDPSDEEIQSDLLIWTAGSQPSSAISSLDVDKDSRGRIKVDRRLKLSGARTEANSNSEATIDAADEVYCLGDIAAVEGLDLVCNAQVALQQSDYVAYNIWAEKERRRPLDFRFLDLGEMMNLGGLEGSVTTLGGRVKFSGKAAGLARRAVYAVRMPTNPQRIRAAASAAAGIAFGYTNVLLDKGVPRHPADRTK